MFKERVVGGPWVDRLPHLRCVLYRLPEVRAALNTGQRVLVVEGERDVETLLANGFVATTTPRGPDNWCPRYAAFLADGRILMLPDNDEKGRSYARQVKASLEGVALSVAVLEIPVMGSGEDVSDWFAARGDAEGLARMLGELQ